MSNPSTSNVAFAELAPHSVYLAVVNGRKLLATRAFSLDAKTDIAGFIAEYTISGTVRASLLAGKTYLHRSGEAESGAVRQPAALQGHVGKLPHGFDSAPTAVVIDAATGSAPDATRATPWLLAAVESSALVSARETLTSLGLAPADITLAAPAHFGAVAGSLLAGETALAVVLGNDDAQLAWITSEGVQHVGVAPLGFADIYEAVQRGLGLKFKAAAGKLFYNDTYDFSEAAPKIAEPLAAAIKTILATHPATHLHILGLIPSQSWLLESIAKILGIHAWAPASAALASRLKLEGEVANLSPRAAGVVQLAAAGATDAPWIQTTLEILAARPRATATPFPSTKTASPLPTAAKPTPAGIKSPVPAPAAAKSVGAPARAPSKKSKGPLFIGGAVVLVGAVVGLAMHFRSPGQRPNTPPPQTPPATTPIEKTPTPNPAPGKTPPPTPIPAPVPTPQANSGATDQMTSPYKYGNGRYRFEVTEKGSIQALSTNRDEILIESAAGISLQGSYVGTDGRRKWFTVGGIDSADYKATVNKTVIDGLTTFQIKVTHPRFELEQTIVCLADRIKINARFTPINLRDPRGLIAAVNSVRLSPVALDPEQVMQASNRSFIYTMKSGKVTISFDNSIWARDGADNHQTIIADENKASFHFNERSDEKRNILNYEISMP